MPSWPLWEWNLFMHSLLQPFRCSHSFCPDSPAGYMRLSCDHFCYSLAFSFTAQLERFSCFCCTSWLIIYPMSSAFTCTILSFLFSSESYFFKLELFVSMALIGWGSFKSLVHVCVRCWGEAYFALETHQRWCPGAQANPASLLAQMAPFHQL